MTIGTATNNGPTSRVALINHPAWDFLIKTAAPAAVAITACCFLTGFVWKAIVLERAGFASGSFDVSVQETAAAGYTVLMFFLLHKWTISGGLLIAIIAFFGIRDADHSNYVMKFISRFMTAVQGFVIVVGIASLGILSGASGAQFQLNKVDEALRDNCKIRCQRYQTKIGRVWGIALFASKDSILLATRRGVRLIPNNQIILVKNRRPLGSTLE